MRRVPTAKSLTRRIAINEVPISIKEKLALFLFYNSNLINDEAVNEISKHCWLRNRVINLIS